jgi:hypothetical protein
MFLKCSRPFSLESLYKKQFSRFESSVIRSYCRQVLFFQVFRTHIPASIILLEFSM